MSFLNNEDSKFLSVRITKKGRNAISIGNFNIKYFQVGDSEFDYNSPYTNYTGVGSVPGQIVFSPFDKDAGVKYPYKFDSSDTATTYGVPVYNANENDVIRNVMGPAGFCSEYIPYNAGVGTTIECHSEEINISQFTGGNSLTVSSGANYTAGDYITVAFTTTVGGTPTITGNSMSLIYKVTGKTSNTLYLDRNVPSLNGVISVNPRVIKNYCENEYGECTYGVNYQGQLNPWSLNVVWGGGMSGSFAKPIGSDYGALDENLSGFTSNVHVSTKNLLGYSTTGQTFVNYTGGTLTYPTSYVNSLNEEILVSPKEQRCVAIVHYSQLGDSTIDAERFYKYDDYISYNNINTNTVAFDNDDEPISDTSYFEMYLPFFLYHRNTSTAGALFKMGEDDFYIKSNYNNGFSMLYRYLLDEKNNKVGKIFPNNKTIVFDDQEIVAALDYRSNRRYTLPSPKIFSIVSDTDASNSLLSTTGKTVWLTYMFTNTGDTKQNAFPCNYYMKTDTLTKNGVVIPSNVAFKFGQNAFYYMKSSSSNLNNGYVATNLYALVQITNSDAYPSSESWKQINITSQITGHTSGIINPTGLTGTTFVITKDMYDNQSTNFDIETHLSALQSNYMGDTTYTTQPQFGDKQYFPGSIKLVRASDVEKLEFLVTLPADKFLQTQNPTYQTGATKKVTDITLLNDKKEVMVIAKTSKPVTRVGQQVFSINLDF